LRVDRRSPELLDLYRRLGVSSAACITACNPLSRKLRDADNRRRMRALERAVTELRCRVLPTLGQDPRGHWPDEPGLLVLGANPDDIAKLGHRFEQNAVLIARRDAVPRLIVNLTKPGTRTAFYT
jgi:hypothetical protein